MCEMCVSVYVNLEIGEDPGFGSSFRGLRAFHRGGNSGSNFSSRSQLAFVLSFANLIWYLKFSACKNFGKENKVKSEILKGHTDRFFLEGNAIFQIMKLFFNDLYIISLHNLNFLILKMKRYRISVISCPTH